jgi:hypothetical protein
MFIPPQRNVGTEDDSFHEVEILTEVTLNRKACGVDGVNDCLLAYHEPPNLAAETWEISWKPAKFL